ncbi:MAG TPA: STAS domain-containing protein [Polyangiaceae bacterium]|nr:STAS domain-containing protein [Polyangiaceae bacterium]
MTLGHVTHAARNGVHVLRYFGSVNYTLAPGLQRFLDAIVHDRALAGLVFDLTAAESLDSTNLGLMARANEEARGAGISQSVIISNKEDIDDVLHSMGFDQSFEVVHTNGAPETNAEPVAVDPVSERDLRRTMLDAHRALMRLSEAGRLEFEQVVACLERDSTASPA